MNRRIIFILLSFSAVIITISLFSKEFINPSYKVGEVMDSLNGVYVHYNRKMDNVVGRNISYDNYNLGLKYQCVEFVKRYYYKHLDHIMPESYGHAKDYFNPQLAYGEKNIQRELIQYKNGSKSKPTIDDLIVFGSTKFNSYGHVGIICKVTKRSIIIIQQNKNKSRQSNRLKEVNGIWTVQNNRVLGWLRKE